MRRVFVWCVLVAAMSVAALFLADMQGMVTLEWLGYRITTRTSVLVGVVGVVFLVCVWLALMIAELWELPARRRAEKQYAQHKNGLASLTQAATAMAMSDHSRALKALKQAQKQLDNAPLALLMEAQLYDKQGLNEKSLPLYQELAAHEETAQLGVRGMLQTAERKGDYAQALNLAEEASKQFPKDRSLFTHTVELMLHEKRADDAIAVLSAWKSHWRMPRDVRLHYLGLSHVIKALALPVEERAPLLEKAYAMLPKHAYVPLALLTSYGAMNHTRTKPLLVHLWHKHPSPALTALTLQWLAEQPDEKRPKLVHAFTKHATQSVESAILRAYDAEARSQLAEAHGALQEALAMRESRRALTLMAEIESELSGTEKARPWFSRAASAPAEEQWICSNCGHAGAEWHVSCPHCHSIDTHQIALPTSSITHIELVGNTGSSAA